MGHTAGRLEKSTKVEWEEGDPDTLKMSSR